MGAIRKNAGGFAATPNGLSVRFRCSITVGIFDNGASARIGRNRRQIDSITNFDTRHESCSDSGAAGLSRSRLHE